MHFFKVKKSVKILIYEKSWVSPLSTLDLGGLPQCQRRPTLLLMHTDTAKILRCCMDFPTLGIWKWRQFMRNAHSWKISHYYLRCPMWFACAWMTLHLTWMTRWWSSPKCCPMDNPLTIVSTLASFLSLRKRKRYHQGSIIAFLVNP